MDIEINFCSSTDICSYYSISYHSEVLGTVQDPDVVFCTLNYFLSDPAITNVHDNSQSWMWKVVIECNGEPSTFNSQKAAKTADITLSSEILSHPTKYHGTGYHAHTRVARVALRN